MMKDPTEILKGDEFVFYLDCDVYLCQSQLTVLFTLNMWSLL